MDKRVLIITYYWPPLAGSGVQRWLKFSKYLPQFGWEPVIFTPENPDFELKDVSLLQEISPTMEIIKFPIWEPYHWFRRLKKESLPNVSTVLEKDNPSLFDRLGIWLRANFLIPDPRKFWVNPSADFIIDCVQKGQFQAIISTGPPHSLHLIAKKVKEKTGIPWIADFRDPWSQWDFNLSLPMQKWARKKHEHLERSVLTQANRIITISPTFQHELAAIGKRSIDLITNGFDESDQVQVESLTNSRSTEVEILYTGIIDALRDPVPFLVALKAAFQSNGKKLRCRFVGKVPLSLVEYVRKDEFLNEHVLFEGYVSHQKVFEFYQKADLLLLILTKEKNSKGNIPGKVFEYMATGKFTLALGDPNGDTAEILSKSNAGKVILHTDQFGIQEFLTHFSPGHHQTNKEEIHQYSRLKLTEKLAHLLNECVRTN
jgi:hypothetical protein